MKKKKTSKYFGLSLIIIMSLIFNLTGFTEITKTASAAVPVTEIVQRGYYDTNNNLNYVSNYDPNLKVTISSISNQTLHLEGYAFDQDCTQNSVDIYVYIYQNSYDKIQIANFKADSYNSAANNEYRCGSYHGFNKNIIVEQTGAWYVEVYANDLCSDGSITNNNSTKSLGPFTFKPKASLSVSSATLTLGSNETSLLHSINVDTNNTGTYNVSTDSSWLTVGTSSSKYYSKTSLSDISDSSFYVFANENKGTSSRTAIITITHTSDSSKQQTITVTQEKPNSQLTVNVTDLTAKADGTLSQSYINVTINNAGFYNVSTDSDWLTVGTSNTKDYSGTRLSYVSNSSFYVFANENTNKNSRTAAITITNFDNSSESKTITVTQEGSTSTPELTVTPTSLTADGEGTIQEDPYITIDTKGTGSYNITSNADWLKFYTSNNKDNGVTSLTSINNSKIFLFADSYAGSSARKATITVTHAEKNSVSQTVTVTQEAAASLSVSRNVVNASVNGKPEVDFIEVTANNTSGFSVEVDRDCTWIHLAKTSDGNKAFSLSFEKSDKFYLIVDTTTNNTKRKGKITVKAKKGDVSETITIQQAELIPVLKASPDSISIGQSGEFPEGKNCIHINTENTGGFTARVEDASWLRLASSKDAGFSDGYAEKFYEDSSDIYLVANENQTESLRTGTITIQHANGDKTITITVKQSAKGAEIFIVDTETCDFDTANKDISSSAVTITASESVSWTITSNDSSWLKVSKNRYLSGDSYDSLSGSGTDSFYIIAEENETYKEREGLIEVTAPGHETHEIHVTQKGKELPPLPPIISQIRFSVTKKTFGIKKTSKVRIHYPDLPEFGVESDDVENWVEKIQYKSLKPNIVSVSKQGVIKGKKKGRAKISVTITLNNGVERASRTIHINVKVGKAKINLKVLKK